jgi:hypothetical protein
LAGIEFAETEWYGDDTTQIDGALVIGKTSNTEAKLDAGSPRGIITPRSEGFLV